MVATEQELTCIGDYLEGKFEGVAQSYETGFAQGQEVGEREMADKACEQFEKELRQMKNILNQVRMGAGKLISVGGSLIQFRKALKG